MRKILIFFTENIFFSLLLFFFFLIELFILRFKHSIFLIFFVSQLNKKLKFCFDSIFFFEVTFKHNTPTTARIGYLS